MVKTLAFLQNPWFRPGTSQRLIDKYRDDTDIHRRILAMSATGRALVKAFGVKLYREIVWDNANPNHGVTRRAKLSPDPYYMAMRIVTYRPDVILLFGRQAQDGFNTLFPDKDPHDCTVLRGAHPMAMGSAVEHLKTISEVVQALYR